MGQDRVRERIWTLVSHEIPIQKSNHQRMEF